MFTTRTLAILLLVFSFLNTVLGQYYVNKVGIPQWQYLTWNTVCSTTLFILVMLLDRWPLIWRNRKNIPWLRLFKIVGPSSVALATIIPGSTMLYSMPNLPSPVAMVPLKGSSIFAGMFVDLAMRIKTSFLLKMAALLAFASLSTAIFWPPKDGFKFLESWVALGVVIVCGLIGYPYRVWAIRKFKAVMQELTPERKLTNEEQTENDKVLAFFDQLGAYLILLFALAMTYVAAYFLGDHTPEPIRDIHYAMAHFNFKVGLISGGVYGFYAFCTLFILMNPTNATFATTTNKILVVMASIGSLVFCYKMGFPKSRWLGDSEVAAIVLVILASVFAVLDYVLKERQKRILLRAALSTSPEVRAVPDSSLVWR